MPKKRSSAEPLQLCSIKCKLSSVVLEGRAFPFIEAIRTVVNSGVSMVLNLAPAEVSQRQEQYLAPANSLPSQFS